MNSNEIVILSKNWIIQTETMTGIKIWHTAKGNSYLNNAPFVSKECKISQSEMCKVFISSIGFNILH